MYTVTCFIVSDDILSPGDLLFFNSLILEITSELVVGKKTSEPGTSNVCFPPVFVITCFHFSIQVFAHI